MEFEELEQDLETVRKIIHQINTSVNLINFLLTKTNVN